jgi:hypothetical protein
MMQSIDEHRDRANGIVERLLYDSMFRRGLLEDPGQALRAAGFEFGAQDSEGVPPRATFAGKEKRCKCTTSQTCRITCNASCKKSCTATEKAS